MNPNRLADWIKDTDFYDNHEPHINDKMDEVEAMLRILDGQLAFRIDAVTKYQAWIKELEVSKQSWEIIAKWYSKTIDEQQAEIDSLKDKLMLAKQSLEIVEGWTKNEYEPPDFFFVEHDLMGKR